MKFGGDIEQASGDITKVGGDITVISSRRPR